MSVIKTLLYPHLFRSCKILALLIISSIVVFPSVFSQSKNTEKTSLIDSWNVTCIHKDSRDLLWIGTEGLGLNVFDGHSIQNIYLSHKNQTNDMSSFIISDIVEDSLGRIWIAISSTIIVLSIQENEIKQKEIKLDKKDLLDKRIRSLEYVKSGHIWANFGEKGYNAIIDMDLNLDWLNIEDTFYPGFLISDTLGNVWVKCNDLSDKILKINTNESTREWHILGLNNDFFFKKLSNGKILVVSKLSNELFELDIGTSKIKPYKDKQFIYQLKDEGLISDLIFEKNGAVWKAHTRGLELISPIHKQRLFKTIPAFQDMNMRLMFEISDSTYWVSLNKNLHEWILGKSKAEFKSSSITISDATSINDTLIYFNTLDSPHIIFNKKSGNFSFIRNPKKSLYRVNVSLKTKADDIIVGKYKYTYPDIFEEIKNCDDFSPLKNAFVFSLLESKDSTLWFGTSIGLFKKKGCNIEKVFSDEALQSQAVNALYEWNEDELIIGLKFGGIVHYHKTKGIIALYNQSNFLSDNRITAILSNDKDGVWVSTFNGLNYINLSKQKVFAFYKKDGLAGNEFNSYSYHKAKNGDLWFGGMEGCTVVPYGIDIFQFKNKTPRLRIKSFNKNSSQSQKNYLLTKDDSVILLADEKYIEFFIGDDNIIEQEKRSYFYYLEGWNNDWMYNGNNSKIVFSNLPPRKYMLHVKTKDALGNYLFSENKVKIIVKGYFYQSLWFKLLSLLSFLFIIVGFIYYRYQQKIKVIQLKEKIARDMHDDIGSTLNGIHQTVYSLKKGKSINPNIDSKLEHISQLSDKVIHDMNDVVWSIDGEDSTFRDLSNRILDFTDDIIHEKDIIFTYDFEHLDMQRQLNFNSKYHLLMICKEGINNAIKHATGNRIQLSMQHEGKSLTLILRNEFQKKQTTKNSSSRGLNNIKNRVKLLKGSVTFNQNNNLFEIKIHIKSLN